MTVRPFHPGGPAADRHLPRLGEEQLWRCWFGHAWTLWAAAAATRPRHYGFHTGLGVVELQLVAGGGLAAAAQLEARLCQLLLLPDGMTVVGVRRVEQAWAPVVPLLLLLHGMSSGAEERADVAVVVGGMQLHTGVQSGVPVVPFTALLLQRKQQRCTK